MNSRDKPLKEATTHELVAEFMMRNCTTRRDALSDTLERMDVLDLMDIFDIEEDGGDDRYDEGHEDGLKEGAEKERAKLLSLVGELAFSISPEAQARVRSYLDREYGVTNIYAARLFEENA